ncbi:P-loop containing nucleoside triphosphate hydrolase protein [Fimicolochytrium jonesii]|uniref:P-loop containing nucleoside triphosphate hydrolase protein n=1 Tax=Fimicolochytrium jonesii TaxID=1396493 RepID=UPI0022FF202A|nr:P-loop containing nucleoside triphosphate hydrolase protein [Fimicolochytrium jonesii]KAI8825997.1 P-loop containing nucleoside triphosphate hydrolase protein [Fimicolochytrium jonesii]
MSDKRESVSPPTEEAEKSSRKRKASDNSASESLDPDELVPVYLRMRPSDGEERFVNAVNDKMVEVSSAEAARVTKVKLAKTENYMFSKVYGEKTTQADLFAEVVGPMVDSVFKPGGYTGVVLAYGASNSGKTFTVNGTSENPGLLVRTIDSVLQRIGTALCRKEIKPARWNDVKTLSHGIIETAKNTILGGKAEFCLFLSFAEVYMEQIYDLYSEPAEKVAGSGKEAVFKNKADSTRRVAQTKEDANGRKYLYAQNEVRIRNKAEAEQAIARMLESRQNVSTNMNSASSRSHLIAVVKVLRVPLSESGSPQLENIETSRISIVDLAGSERLGISGVEGKAHGETKKIHQGLHALANCIEIMRQNHARTGKKSHIPWRDSKLTMLLQPYFEAGQPAFIINVNPSMIYRRVTLEVFRFAQRAGALRSEQAIAPSQANSQVTELMNQIEVLRQQLYEQQLKLVEQEMEIRESCAKDMSRRLHEIEVKYQDRRQQAELFEAERLEKKLDMASAMFKEQIQKLQRRIAEQSSLIEKQRKQIEGNLTQDTVTQVLQQQISSLHDELNEQAKKLDKERKEKLALQEEVERLRLNATSNVQPEVAETRRNCEAEAAEMASRSRDEERRIQDERQLDLKATIANQAALIEQLQNDVRRLSKPKRSKKSSNTSQTKKGGAPDDTPPPVSAPDPPMGSDMRPTSSVEDQVIPPDGNASLHDSPIEEELDKENEKTGSTQSQEELAASQSGRGTGSNPDLGNEPSTEPKQPDVDVKLEAPVKKTRRLKGKKAVAIDDVETPARRKSQKRYSSIVHNLTQRG